MLTGRSYGSCLGGTPERERYVCPCLVCKGTRVRRKFSTTDRRVRSSNMDEGSFQVAAERYRVLISAGRGDLLLYQYELAEALDGSGQYDESVKELIETRKEAKSNIGFTNEIDYDIGRIRVIQSLQDQNPPLSPLLNEAEHRFRLFIENGGSPRFWIYCHLACIHSIRSENAVGKKKNTLIDKASRELSRAIDEINEFPSPKAKTVAAIMRDWLGDDYRRGVGGPADLSAASPTNIS